MGKIAIIDLWVVYSFIIENIIEKFSNHVKLPAF